MSRALQRHSLFRTACVRQVQYSQTIHFRWQISRNSKPHDGDEDLGPAHAERIDRGGRPQWAARLILAVRRT